MGKDKPISNNYYSSIDGLRAICFLLVFLFHCNTPGFQFGWAGVTVFFVISGFLITEILIGSKDSQSFFKSFYMRRILRIFPIYFTVVFGVTFLFIIIKRTLPGDLIYHITYTQNVFWVISGYISDLQPFLAHTWSLAIEEQFYLIWPLLIWVVPKKHLSKLCTIVFLFAVVFRIIMVLFEKNEYATSILLFSQIDTLALGALLACYKQNLINDKITGFLIKNSALLGFVGIISIIAFIGFSNGKSLYFAYDLLRNTKFYLDNIFTAQIYFFVALFAVGIIKLCYEVAPRILSNKVLIHLGKISYGMYLYHWIVIIMIKRLIPGTYNILFVITAFVMTYLISLVSFNTLEKYFRKLKYKFTYANSAVPFTK